MVFDNLATQLGWPVWVIAILIVWTLIWKGLALWKSARLNQPIWFVVLLVVNTAGILPILYIFFFSRINFTSPKKKGKSKLDKVPNLFEKKKRRKKKK